MRLKLAVLIFVCLLAAVQPALGLSKARFMNIEKYGLSPSLLTSLDSRIAVYDPSKPILAIVDPSSGEVKEVRAPSGLVEIASSNGRVYGISGEEAKLYAFTATGYEEVMLPDLARAIYASEKYVWVCIPDRRLVLGFDSESLEEEFRFKVSCAAGRQVLSESDGLLWILSSDYKTVLRIDLASGEKVEKKFENSVIALASRGRSVFIAFSSDEVYRLDENLKILDSWKLPKESSIKLFIHPLESRRFIYVAYARWRIGEVEEGRLIEVSTNGTAEHASPGSDRIWFLLPNKGEVGWAFYSRSPRILDFKVEQSGESFKAVAEVFDPEGDLSKVLLALKHPPKVEGLPPRIDRFEMKLEDGRWVGEFKLKPGEKVYAYVEAFDEVGNVGRSREVEVARSVETTKISTITISPTTSTAGGGGIPGFEIYLAGSSLLLLIPIVFAVLLSRRRRRRRRK